MAPLGGLNGRYGAGGPYGQTGTVENYGRPADPRHAIGGEASAPVMRKYSFPTYEVLGDITDVGELTGAGSGVVYDHTPQSHAAPWPRGIPVSQETWGEALETLHGTDLGGVGFHVKGHATAPELSYTSGRFPAPNQTGVAAGVPGQLRGGPGGFDTTQGYGVPNTIDVFAAGQQIRRQANEGIVFDRTLRWAGERPFLGAHPVVQARFDGPDSPFGEYGDTSRLGIKDTPHSDPSPYAQPANPNVTSSMGSVSDVPDYGWT